MVFETTRQGFWWLSPLSVLVGLSAFLVYSTWAAFQGEHYTFGPYISPFYSPEIFGGSPHSWFGPKPSWWPQWLPFSPSFLILWVPAGFRFTCYYFRGAYYKAFWLDPPDCAVGELRTTYRGEQKFPLIVQNIHRYFMYLAAAFIVLHTRDVWHAMWFVSPQTGTTSFGIGVGSLILLIDVVLLSAYVFGCHSVRHLVGGALDTLTRSRIRLTAHACSSRFNERHMLWAWVSLAWVGCCDLYVRLCSMGVIADWRIL